MRCADLTGEKFGRWTVGSRAGSDASRSSVWNCVCECGVARRVKATSLRSGASKSCGCFGKELAAESCRRRLTTHGETAGRNSRIYRIWANMLSRCENPKFDAYPYYGARGIKVCDEWKVFSNFLTDMGHPPSKFSIDRIDPNGNYEPSNCRWVSHKVQVNNRRSSLFIEIDGRRMTVAQWALEPGAVAVKTIYARLKLGWSYKKAVFMPTPKPQTGQLVEVRRHREAA